VSSLSLVFQNGQLKLVPLVLCVKGPHFHCFSCNPLQRILDCCFPYFCMFEISQHILISIDDSYAVLDNVLLGCRLDKRAYDSKCSRTTRQGCRDNTFCCR
jgi:hypothetical protein